MGTRSTIKWIRKDGDKFTPLVNIYRQYDGYIDGVGHQLAEWLLEKRIVNGIPLNNTYNIANGFECLIAQYIRDFKKGPGVLYIADMNDFQEYNYEVIFDDDIYFSGKYDSVNDLIKIKVDSYPNFEGTPYELLNFKESEYE